MQDLTHKSSETNMMFKSRFSVELRNRFAVLEVEENINADCVQMQNIYTETAENVLGRAKKKNKQWRFERVQN